MLNCSVEMRYVLINNPMYEFFRPVLLYVKGNLIVQYVGADEVLLQFLTELLGPELLHMAPFIKLPAYINIRSAVSGVTLTNRDITDESSYQYFFGVIIE